MEAKLAVIRGDGIGPDIVEQALLVLHKIEEKFGHKFHCQDVLAGGCAIDAVGNCLPQETIDVCKAADAVLLGAVGAPVFANFSGGLGVLMGQTGGYILGFIGSALVMWAMERLLGDRVWVLGAGMVLGMLVCYAFGTAWFMVVYPMNGESVGLWTALTWCVFPYVVFDLIKIGLALGLTSQLRRHVR